MITQHEKLMAKKYSQRMNEFAATIERLRKYSAKFEIEKILNDLEDKLQDLQFELDMINEQEGE